MKLQGFAMSWERWQSVKDMLSPKAKVKDVIDSYDLVKLVRILDNRERFRSVR